MIDFFFFFKQKTAYEIYQCDWSSDVCSSDLEDNFNGKCKIIMPPEKNLLIIESKKWTDLLLDVKESYDNSELGRFYEFDEKKKIIKFKKENDYEVYIALKGKFEVKKTDRWVKKDYKFDQKRNSPPFERYVYSVFKFKGRLIISASDDKNKAVKELKNIPSLKFYKPKTGLTQLLVKDKVVGIYAGLPWFFQFWSRDELISLKALMLSGKRKQVKDILFRNLNAIAKDGRLPNQTFPLSEKTNADSIGWLFKRIQDYQRFTPIERKLIIMKLDYSIRNLKKNYMKDGLIYNNPLETWMDTEWGDDNREGFRIEIQVLFLNMLKLAYSLTRKEKYLKLEEKMKKLVRDRFWNGKDLADGLDDFTKRPNVFIVAYVYPELLTKKEWELCFKNIIPSLWLPWGGLSTIDKKHALFCKEHTGEIPKSYHRGDSWYWINNLAAIVMHRANKYFFKTFVNQIFKASKKEFTKMGIFNQQSELSSASKLESRSEERRVGKECRSRWSPYH